MKVKATCNLKHNGDWYTVGQTFEIPDRELEALKDMVEPEAQADAYQEQTEVRTEEEKPRRTVRKKKLEE